MSNKFTFFILLLGAVCFIAAFVMIIGGWR